MAILIFVFIIIVSCHRKNFYAKLLKKSKTITKFITFATNVKYRRDAIYRVSAITLKIIYFKHINIWKSIS